MAAKSVIDIDVNDEDFKDFEKSFRKYSDALAKTPGQWRETNRAVGDMSRAMTPATTAFDKSLHALQRMTEEAKRFSRAMQEANRALAGGGAAGGGPAGGGSGGGAGTAGGLLGMLRGGGAVGALVAGVVAIRSIIGNVQSAVVAPLMALGGAGGSIYGFEKLAARASDRRRFATGVGMGERYGQLSAFQNVFGRIADPDRIVSGISEAQYDIQSPMYTTMRAMGLDTDPTASPAVVGADFLARVRQMGRGLGNKALVGPMMRAYGVDQTLSPQDIRRTLWSSDKEFAQFQKEFVQKQKSLDISESSLKSLQDFDVQLDYAGRRLDNLTQNVVSPLAGEMTKLSSAISDLVAGPGAFMKMRTEVWLLTKGLELANPYVRDFADYMSKLSLATQFFGGPGAQLYGGQPGAQGRLGHAGPRGASGALPEAGAGDLDAAAHAIAQIESGGRYDALGPVTGGSRAYGKYQVMGFNVGPWTKQALGQALTPQQFLKDPDAQERVFRHIFGQYIEKYGMAGASQAWFGGPGSVGQTGRADVLGTTVGGYSSRFLAGVQAYRGTSITINNNTGGAASVSVNQTAHP